MINNEFEKQLQRKLNGYEIEPSENLLDNILDKRASRPRGFMRVSYLRVGAAMLSITTLVAILVWFGQNDYVEIAGSTVQHSGQSVLQNIPDNDMAPANSRIELTEVETHSGVSSAKPVNRLSDNSEKVEKSAGNQSIASGHKSSSGVVSKSSHNDVVSAPEKVSDSRSSKKSAKNAFTGSADISERYFNVDAADRPVISSSSHNNNSHLYVYETISDDRLAEIGLNSLFSRPVKKVHVRVANNESNEKLATAKAAYRTKTRKPLFLDIMYTPMLSMHSAGSSNSNIAGNYKAMSVSNMNQQFGLRLSYPVKDRWSVFAGAAYLNLNSSYEGTVSYKDDAVRYETNTTYINDPVRGTIIVTKTDTVNYVKETSQQFKAMNRYSIVQIPLGVSYNFGFGKLTFAAHGSALVNVYTSGSGHNLDFAARNTTAFKSDKKSVGMGAGLSVMALYPVSNRFGLFLEPGFQYFSIKGSRTGNIVNERIFNNSLTLGLRYNIF